MQASAADGREPLTCGRRSLAKVIAPPAHCGPVLTQCARVEAAAADGHKPLTLGRHDLAEAELPKAGPFSVRTSAPADGFAVGAQRTGVEVAAADGDESLARCRRRVGRRWREGVGWRR